MHSTEDERDWSHVGVSKPRGAFVEFVLGGAPEMAVNDGDAVATNRREHGSGADEAFEGAGGANDCAVGTDARIE